MDEIERAMKSVGEKVRDRAQLDVAIGQLNRIEQLLIGLEQRVQRIERSQPPQPYDQDQDPSLFGQQVYRP